MGYPGSQVDVAALGRMSAAVRAAAEAFGVVHADSGRLAGDAALPGWPVARAVMNAEQVWTEFLRQLAGQVDRLGDGMARAATDYQAADQSAASRVAEAGRPPR